MKVRLVCCRDFHTSTLTEEVPQAERTSSGNTEVLPAASKLRGSSFYQSKKEKKTKTRPRQQDKALLSLKRSTAPWQACTASNMMMLLRADPLLLILPGAFPTQQVRSLQKGVGGVRATEEQELQVFGNEKGKHKPMGEKIEEYSSVYRCCFHLLTN